MDLNTGALSSGGYINEAPDTLGSLAKGAALGADLQNIADKQEDAKKKRMVVSNLPSLMGRIKENQSDFDAVAQVAQYAPGMIDYINAANKQDTEVADKRKAELVNNLAGAYAFIASADQRKQTKEQVWQDVMKWNQAHGIDMGDLANEPYSDEAMARMKGLVLGTKALTEGGKRIVVENGVIKEVSPEGEEFKGQVSNASVTPVVREIEEGGFTRTVQWNNQTGRWDTVATAPREIRKPEKVVGDDGKIYWLAPGESLPAGVKAGGGAGAPSEDERKAAGWVAQARTSLANMDEALRLDSAADTPGATESALKMVGAEGAAQSSARQRYATAAASFAEAALRAATGAGVNRDEAEQKIKELTPQYWDKPETKKQKYRQLGMYIDSLEQRAGRALKQQSGTTEKPPAQPKAGMIKNGYRFKGGNPADPKAWEKL